LPRAQNSLQPLAMTTEDMTCLKAMIRLMVRYDDGVERIQALYALMLEAGAEIADEGFDAKG
jgi:hypothetical protein